jgi:hypothetical protein
MVEGSRTSKVRYTGYLKELAPCPGKEFLKQSTPTFIFSSVHQYKDLQIEEYVLRSGLRQADEQKARYSLYEGLHHGRRSFIAGGVLHYYLSSSMQNRRVLPSSVFCIDFGIDRPFGSVTEQSKYSEHPASDWSKGHFSCRCLKVRDVEILAVTAPSPTTRTKNSLPHHPSRIAHSD